MCVCVCVVQGCVCVYMAVQGCCECGCTGLYVIVGVYVSAWFYGHLWQCVCV